MIAVKMTDDSTPVAASQPHPVDVHVGKRLRMQRNMLGLSQKAVGEQVGVTFQQIQKYERGVNRVSASQLQDFAKVLQVPVGFFFEGQGAVQDYGMGEVMGMAEPEAAPYNAGAPAASNKETMDFLRAYHRISDPTLRKKVLDLMRAMADSSAND